WYIQQTDETQKTYNKDLENEETRYIENTDNALDIRLEQYINLKEPHRRTVIDKLTSIANTSKSEEEKKRANNSEKEKKQEEYKVIKTKGKTPVRYKHFYSNVSMISEAGSSWSEDSAVEDKKFQEEQDKVIRQVLEQQDKNDPTRMLLITGETSTKGKGTPPVRPKDNQYGYSTNEIMSLEQSYWKPQKRK
ncbi:13055_t:CDS:2, partial [Racocetra fulgida]